MKHIRWSTILLQVVRHRTPGHRCHHHFGLLVTMLLGFCSAIHAVASDGQELVPLPQPNPPEYITATTPEPVRRSLNGQPPHIEWLYHKTADNGHPDANEQQALWLINRARMNPPAEGEWLAALDDPDVMDDRDAIPVDLDVLVNEFALIPEEPPAAFDRRLYAAAEDHSRYMITANSQTHYGIQGRLDATGFNYTSAGNTVFAFAESSIHNHAALNIDWDPYNGDGTGMQIGRGHRVVMMSQDTDRIRNYTNVGLALVAAPSGSPPPPPPYFPNFVGPLVFSGVFCTARSESYGIPVPDHFNRFLVGTVWDDANDNMMYDPGEGIGNVTVMPDKGTYYAITTASGGYAVPMTEDGILNVTFSGAGLPTDMIRTTKIETDSVLLDLIVDVPPFGNLNGDYAVDLQDLILALRVNCDQPTAAFIHQEADANGNNRIDLAEVVYILQKMSGIRN